jgi:hypothetical protein
MSDTKSLVRRRLKLVDIVHDRFPDGRCSVQVVMEWHGRTLEGLEEGTQTTQGILRAGALATLTAANMAADDGIDLELVGVKAIKAFDAEVIIAAVRGVSPESRYRLIGSCAASTDTEPARGAVLAVLDALNRILEKYVPVE